MSETGGSIPEFALPGTTGTAVRVYRFRWTDAERVALLAFPSTEARPDDEFHPISNLVWFSFVDGVDVYVVADEAIRDAAGAVDVPAGPLPTLSDVDDSVAAACGVTDRDGSAGRLCLIDQTGTVRTTWSLATDAFDPEAVHETTTQLLDDTDS